MSTNPPADANETADVGQPPAPSATPDKNAVKRGRPTKPPPPPKVWRIEGLSPEGLKVTLGRYATREEAEPEFGRLSEDGFYLKLKILESPDSEEEAAE